MSYIAFDEYAARPPMPKAELDARIRKNDAYFRSRRAADPNFARLCDAWDQLSAQRQRELEVHRYLKRTLLDKALGNKKHSPIASAILLALKPGHPLHLDQLMLEAGCDREKLHRSLAALRRAGHIINPNVGFWQLNPKPPKRWAPGALSGLVYDSLNSKRGSTAAEVAVALSISKYSAYQALMTLLRQEKVIRVNVRKGDKWLRAPETNN